MDFMRKIIAIIAGLLLLGSVHIGEVQASVWDAETRSACEKAGIPLL